MFATVFFFFLLFEKVATESNTKESCKMRFIQTAPFMRKQTFRDTLEVARDPKTQLQNRKKIALQISNLIAYQPNCSLKCYQAYVP